MLRGLQGGQVVAVPLYSPSDVKIVDWRMDCFVERGFHTAYAAALAARRDVDRALVERLLDEGATHEQVLDIVL